MLLEPNEVRFDYGQFTTKLTAIPAKDFSPDALYSYFVQQAAWMIYTENPRLVMETEPSFRDLLYRRITKYHGCERVK